MKWNKTELDSIKFNIYFLEAIRNRLEKEVETEMSNANHQKNSCDETIKNKAFKRMFERILYQVRKQSGQISTSFCW